MGRYEYHCPGCGQKQSTRAEGAPVAHNLCAACDETVRTLTLKAQSKVKKPGQLAGPVEVYQEAKGAEVPLPLVRYLRDQAAQHTFDLGA